MRWTIARPSPVPRPNEPRNGWKMASTSSGGMPVPSSRTPTSSLPILDGDEQLQAPAVGHRLESVGGQVPDDLPQLVLVGVHPDRVRRHLDLDHVVVGGLGAVAQQRGGVLDGPAGVDPGELHLPGPGVGEKGRDGRVQAIRLAQDDVHQRGLLGRQRQLAAQHLHRARHRGQRVADFVGDAGGHLAHRGQPLPHLRGPFQALDVGDVLEREDDAALAAGQRQRRGAHAQVDVAAVGAVVGVVDAAGPAEHASP